MPQYGQRWPKLTSGSSGGGAGIYDEAPGGASAYDDEFISPTLDAKWTEVNSPHASFSLDYASDGTFLFMGGPGNATRILTLRQSMVKASGTAVGVTMKCEMSSYTGDPYIEMAVQNGSTLDSGSRVKAYLQENGQQKAFAYDGSNNPSVDLGLKNGPVYLHLQRNTSNLVNVYASADGVAWRRFFSFTAAWDINYLFVGMVGQTSTATAHRIDWIRVDDARFTQPM